MQDLAAELTTKYSADKFCPKCGFYTCQCEAIAYEKKLEAYRREQEALEQKKRVIADLGGLRAYEDFTAEKYSNKSVLKALAAFPQENYYLWGKAGVGKTHAAVAVLRTVPGAKVVRMGQISREVRSCETPFEEEEVISKYANRVFLLDDLGSEKSTEFLQNILFEMMDRRWQNKRGGLIITANMSIDKLGGIIGDRTASRIAGLVGPQNVLELSGKDYRLGARK